MYHHLRRKTKAKMKNDRKLETRWDAWRMVGDTPWHARTPGNSGGWSEMKEIYGRMETNETK